MKKLIATIAMSSLALIPAASAWAGGDTGRAAEQPADIATLVSSTKGDVPADRIFAIGCYQGYVYLIHLNEQGQFYSSNFGVCPQGHDYLHFF